MSGHSKWHTIKHKKGALDAKRGRLFTKLIREMTIAARIGGGDPDSNPRLRTAVDKAKGSNMPADNIVRAIKKGTGELEGTTYEDLQLEGYGPGGVAILVEGTTDNRNRTVSEIRHIFTKYGGNLGGAGSVAYMFKPKGVISIAAEKTTEDRLMEIALDAGADDIVTEAAGFSVAARLRGRSRRDQEGRDRAGRGRDQEAGRQQHHPRRRQGPAAAEARRDARRPRRRLERLGQLRHLRGGDGGGGRELA
jgi:YebC/PmpR family DNA-binding regulatory protein